MRHPFADIKNVPYNSDGLGKVIAKDNKNDDSFKRSKANELHHIEEGKPHTKIEMQHFEFHDPFLRKSYPSFSNDDDSEILSTTEIHMDASFGYYPHTNDHYPFDNSSIIDSLYLTSSEGTVYDDTIVFDHNINEELLNRDLDISLTSDDINLSLADPFIETILHEDQEKECAQMQALWNLSEEKYLGYLFSKPISTLNKDDANKLISSLSTNLSSRLLLRHLQYTCHNLVHLATSELMHGYVEHLSDILSGDISAVILYNELMQHMIYIARDAFGHVFLKHLLCHTKGKLLARYVLGTIEQLSMDVETLRDPYGSQVWVSLVESANILRDENILMKLCLVTKNWYLWSTFPCSSDIVYTAIKLADIQNSKDPINLMVQSICDHETYVKNTPKGNQIIHLLKSTKSQSFSQVRQYVNGVTCMRITSQQTGSVWKHL